MKLVKMSLLAAALIGTSAFAIDNVKVSGDAKLFYATMDGVDTTYTANPDAGYFNSISSAGQAALGLGLTADLTEGVSAGVHLTALSSLGLGNNLVSAVWEGAGEDEFWFDEAWVAGTVGKTTGKIGRMQLDTPLVFSEQWSIAYNTFEAAVVMNEDIPDTTLIGAYIGQSNGGEAVAPSVSGYAGVTADFDNGTANTNFHSFYKGAYAVGAINNSWSPLTVQAWYYQAQSLLNAYWLQGDLAFDMGLTAGVQFTGIDYSATGLNEIVLGSGTLAEDSSNTAVAVKVGYEMADVFAVSGAFSQTGNDDTNALGAGGNLAAYGQSKLYTEAWWNYGYITANDTSAFNVTVSLPEALTWVALDFFYTQSTSKDGITAGTDTEMKEATLAASKSFGPLDTSLAYTYTDANDQNLADAAIADSGEGYGNIQVYLTYNF